MSLYRDGHEGDYDPLLDGRDERYYDLPEHGPGYAEALLANTGTPPGVSVHTDTPEGEEPDASGEDDG